MDYIYDGGISAPVASPDSGDGDAAPTMAPTGWLGSYLAPWTIGRSKDTDQSQPSASETAAATSTSGETGASADSSQSSDWWGWGSSLAASTFQSVSATGTLVLDVYKKDLGEIVGEIAATGHILESYSVVKKSKEALSTTASLVSSAVKMTMDEVAGDDLVDPSQDVNDGKVNLWSWMTPASSNSVAKSSDASGRQNRLQQRVTLLRRNIETFSTMINDDHDGVGSTTEFLTWDTSFQLDDREDEVGYLLQDCGDLSGMHANLVPSVVSQREFWCRYFFRLHLLYSAEEERCRLLDAARRGCGNGDRDSSVTEEENDDEGFRWDDDGPDNATPLSTGGDPVASSPATERIEEGTSNNQCETEASAMCVTTTTENVPLFEKEVEDALQHMESLSVNYGVSSDVATSNESATSQPVYIPLVTASQPVSGPAISQPVSGPAISQPVSSPAISQPVSVPPVTQPVSVRAVSESVPAVISSRPTSVSAGTVSQPASVTAVPSSQPIKVPAVIQRLSTTPKASSLEDGDDDWDDWE